MPRPDVPRSDVLVSVVAPLCDAAPFVERFLRDLSGVLARTFKDFEIVLVDNVSKDDTVARVERLQRELRNVQLYCLQRRVDTEVAFVVGLEQAIGDLIITVDASGDPVARIPDLIALYDEGRADVVYGLRGDRLHRSLRGGLYNLLSRLFYRGFRLLTHEALPEASSNFRLYSRRAVNSFLDNRDRYHLFSVLATFAGLPYLELPYERTPRPGAPRTATLGVGFLKATRILLLSSQQPLRVLALASLAGAVLNLLYSGYVVAVNIFKTRVAEGWTTLSLQNSMMFFLLFLILAALCEYTLRLFMQGQERPRYTIARESRSLVLSRKQELNVAYGLEQDAGAPPARKARA